MVVFKDFFLNVHPYTWENDPVFFFVDIFSVGLQSPPRKHFAGVLIQVLLRLMSPPHGR